MGSLGLAVKGSGVQIPSAPLLKPLLNSGFAWMNAIRFRVVRVGCKPFANLRIERVVGQAQCESQKTPDCLPKEMDADVVGVQELWDRQCLKAVSTPWASAAGFHERPDNVRADIGHRL